MLPPFIIEQIRQREEQERRREENSRPRAHLPIQQRPAATSDAPADDEADRGVVIVDLMG
jgi:hypothetical protein